MILYILLASSAGSVLLVGAMVGIVAVVFGKLFGGSNSENEALQRINSETINKLNDANKTLLINPDNLDALNTVANHYSSSAYILTKTEYIKALEIEKHYLHIKYKNDNSVSFRLINLAFLAGEIEELNHYYNLLILNKSEELVKIFQQLDSLDKFNKYDANYKIIICYLYSLDEYKKGNYDKALNLRNSVKSAAKSNEIYANLERYIKFPKL